MTSFFPTTAHRRNLDHINPTPGLIHTLSGQRRNGGNLHRFEREEDESHECGDRGTPKNILHMCPIADLEVKSLRRRLRHAGTAERTKLAGGVPSKKKLNMRFQDNSKMLVGEDAIAVPPEDLE